MPVELHREMSDIVIRVVTLNLMAVHTANCVKMTRRCTRNRKKKNEKQNQKGKKRFI